MSTPKPPSRDSERRFATIVFADISGFTAMSEKIDPEELTAVNGADKAVQEYLRSKSYDLVEVFCSGDSCRNNTGGWPMRTVPVPMSGKRKDFSFYATKDCAMADEASIGLMLWDRESVGTVMNVLRLVRHHKQVVIYVAPDHEFVDVKNESDWQQLLARCADELKQRIEKEAVVEQGADRGSPQATTL